MARTALKTGLFLRVSLWLTGNCGFFYLVSVFKLYLLCLPSLTVFTLFQGLHGPYPFGQS